MSKSHDVFTHNLFNAWLGDFILFNAAMGVILSHCSSNKGNNKYLISIIHLILSSWHEYRVDTSRYELLWQRTLHSHLITKDQKDLVLSRPIILGDKSMLGLFDWLVFFHFTRNRLNWLMISQRVQHQQLLFHSTPTNLLTLDRQHVFFSKTTQIP